MQYDDFRAAVEAAAASVDPARVLIPIPALRRQLQGRLGRDQFDQYLLQLHRDGFVHLLTHVEAEKLAEEDKADCLRHPSGLLVYWMCWL